MVLATSTISREPGFRGSTTLTCLYCIRYPIVSINFCLLHTQSGDYKHPPGYWLNVSGQL